MLLSYIKCRKNHSPNENHHHYSCYFVCWLFLIGSVCPSLIWLWMFVLLNSNVFASLLNTEHTTPPHQHVQCIHSNNECASISPILTIYMSVFSSSSSSSSSSHVAVAVSIGFENGNFENGNQSISHCERARASERERESEKWASIFRWFEHLTLVARKE